MPGRSLADAARDDRHRLSRALHRPGDVAAQFGQQNAKSPLSSTVYSTLPRASSSSNRYLRQARRSR
jgi:hypothetical protein